MDDASERGVTVRLKAFGFAATMLTIAAFLGFQVASGVDAQCPSPGSSSSPSPTGSSPTGSSPTATGSPEPTGTESPDPEPTDTTTPEPTDTTSPEPTDTATPEPTDTATPEPTEGGGIDVVGLTTITPPGVAPPTVGARPAAAAEDSPAPSPTPDPCASGSITLAASPSAAVWGTTFTIHGVLRCQGAIVRDAIVLVTRLGGGGGDFDDTAARATSGSGAFSVTDRPSQSAEYIARWHGNESCGRGATSRVARADVRPGVVLNAAKTTIKNGSPAVLTGSVIPAHPGHWIVLQVLQGSSKQWKDATWVRLDSQGRFRVAHRKSGGPGFLVLRAGYPTQHRDHAWNVSRSIRVDWAR